MILRAGYIVVAQKLQEAADKLSASDTCQRLRDAISDKFRGSGDWGYYIDHIGDSSAGDVIYSSNGDTFKAPYTLGSESAAQAKIDFTTSKAVTPRVIYEEEAELAEAKRKAGEDLKLTETTDQLGEGLSLLESTAAGNDFEIKLIAPGAGSSAYYPKEVLERDGPKVFKAGTHIYVNHATPAEEAERPEGDWNKLAGALKTDATWKESHKNGPGLYAVGTFTSEMAPKVKEKAAISGMSIRAAGSAVMENGKPVLKEGRPLLAKLTHAESVDLVTRAGAGGMVLTEAAVSAKSTTGGDMDAAEIKKLQEGLDAQAVLNKRLLERALKGDALREATTILAGTALAEASRSRVVEAVCAGVIPAKDGELDMAVFRPLVEAAAKSEGEYVAKLIPQGVRGMGSPAPVVQIDAAETARLAEAKKRSHEDAVQTFIDLGMTEAAAKHAAQKEAA